MPSRVFDFTGVDVVVFLFLISEMVLNGRRSKSSLSVVAVRAFVECC